MDERQTVFFTMLCANAVVSFIVLFFGYRFRNNPPKEINRWHGYRTRRSMKNMDTWIFAHHICGELFSKIGRFALPLSVAVVAATYSSDVNTTVTAGLIAMAVQIVAIFVSIFKVEKALKETFDEEGNRKQ